MNASPFVKPFKERASTWETLLQTLQDMLDNWLQCQVRMQLISVMIHKPASLHLHVVQQHASLAGLTNHNVTQGFQ
jgi:hypothetical protein